MRFITEFENDGTKFDQQVTAYRKERGQLFLGNLITESFGWEEKEKPPHMHSSPTRYTLEIEAFPMEKWIEFKEKMFQKLNLTEYDRYTLSEFIKELESFGKPAGERV